MIEFTCSSCQMAYRVTDDRAGSQGTCKGCGAVIIVPQTGAGEGPPRGIGDFSSQRASSYGSGRYDAPVNDRPMGAIQEESTRKRRITLLGIFLIVGFILPSCVPDFGGMRVVFLNIEALTQPRVPLGMKLLFIYPLLAGGIALVAAASMRAPVRGWLLFCVGLLPLILLIAVDPQELLGNISRAMSTGGGTLTVIMGIIGVLGFYAVWIGARSRFYRPDFNHTYTIGLVGAIAMLLTLVVPQEGTIPLLAPIEAFQLDGGLGMIMLMTMAGMIMSSILCIMNTPSRSMRIISSRGLMAYWTLLGSIIFAVSVGIIYSLAESRMDAQMLPYLISVLLKLVFMYAAMIAVLPMGLVDATIGDVPKRGHCPTCGYNLFGNTTGQCPECGRTST